MVDNYVRPGQFCRIGDRGVTRTKDGSPGTPMECIAIDGDKRGRMRRAAGAVSASKNRPRKRPTPHEQAAKKLRESEIGALRRAAGLGYDGALPRRQSQYDKLKKAGLLDADGNLTPDGLDALKLRDRIKDEEIPLAGTGTPHEGQHETANQDEQQKPAQPEPVLPPRRPTPIDMTRANNAPFSENMWGTGSDHPVSYHPDGPWGNAVRRLGPEQRVDYDGLPLKEHLDRVATDVIRGDRTTNDAIGELKRVRDRLPEGTRARREVEGLLDEIDYPMTPCPEIPEGAHPVIAEAIREIHAVPAARRDTTELDALLEVARQSAARPGRNPALWAMDVERAAYNRRHESNGAEGKFDIDRAARKAAETLRKARR